MRKELESKNQLIAVAVDNDKTSQNALKWAADHVISKGHEFILLHVRRKLLTIPSPSGKNVPIEQVDEDIIASFMEHLEIQTKEILLPFQCFSSRRGLQSKEIVLEETDVAKAIVDCIKQLSIDKIILGSSTRNAFTRTFKGADVPTTVSKNAPNFCSVFVISKGKISFVRPATNPITYTVKRQSSNKSISMERNSITSPSSPSPANSFQSSSSSLQSSSSSYQSGPSPSNSITGGTDDETIKSPFSRLGNGYKAVAPRNYDNRIEGNPRGNQYGGPFDLSFPSGSSSPAARSSIDMLSMGSMDRLSVGSTDRMSIGSIDRPGINSLRDQIDGGGRRSRMSNMHDSDMNSYSSDQPFRSYESSRGGGMNWSSGSGSTGYENSSIFSQDGAGSSSSSRQSLVEVEIEMRRLKNELEKTMDIYNSAYREALFAKQKAMYQNLWKMEDELGTEDERFSRVVEYEHAEREKQRCKEAMEAAKAAQRKVEREAVKRFNGENKLFQEEAQARKEWEPRSNDVPYKIYTKEEMERVTDGFSDALKVGEGGYGPVFKSTLDHTDVAIKILRSDANQGMKQFQQEVEVLSHIRHPNMVLLMGACPENGCLVYEYMSNGSLEDCLFQRGNNPPLSCKLRFKIATEIAAGLLYMHQNKPEPLVHRDLKPANILLDDNFVSKISDVGLARLVPPSVANQVTQYHMTAAAGTFCYIDPEYQMTGLLGIKSDVYALGIILLQLITAKPPMGISHNVERSIERGTFAEMLDPAVKDWPVEAALRFAQLALKCAELRKKDRPDLGTVVLPELNRLMALVDRITPQALVQQPGFNLYGRH